MQTDVFRIDTFDRAPPTRSADEALDQAMLRSYTIERSVDYGCSLEDVLKLRRRVEGGYAWVDVALLLAEDNEARAQWYERSGQRALASRYLSQAAACYRLAQASLELEPERRVQVYQRQASLFRQALVRAPGEPAEGFEVLHQGAPHAAWLFRAGPASARGPVVVVWGGADGWCEAFHTSVPYYLERGLSVCLLELPGQGLARWAHGAVLDLRFTELVSSAIDALVGRGLDADRVGVVGHSAGGAFALAAAAADPRIRACCSNGGSPYLAKGLQKFPRVLQRFSRMMGDDVSEAQVTAFLDGLDLQGSARQMSAALLCLHGGLDTLVELEESRQLVALRGAAHATLALWPEGVHCLYGHAVERNSALADWFTGKLT